MPPTIFQCTDRNECSITDCYLSVSSTLPPTCLYHFRFSKILYIKDVCASNHLPLYMFHEKIDIVYDKANVWRMICFYNIHLCL